MTVNQVITDRFLEALRGGKVAWQKPWKCLGYRNALTKHLYRGVNVLILHALGNDSFFLTERQIFKLGGKIKDKNLKIPILFYTVNEDGKTGKKFFISRYYRVHGLSNIDGLKLKVEGEKLNEDFNPIKNCEEFVKAQNADIQHGGNRAFFSVDAGFIGMPNQKQFKSEAHYYLTLFHELTHREGKVTGAKVDWTHFGDDPYSKEELVAEIGANFLAGHLGVNTEGLFENSVAYLQSWIKKFENDPQFVISAAQQAQKRFDTMLKKYAPNEAVAIPNESDD